MRSNKAEDSRLETFIMARATPLGLELTSSHWGAYEVQRIGTAARGLGRFRDDRAPSPIGLSMFEAYRSPLRVHRPAVRAGWLDYGGRCCNKPDPAMVLRGVYDLETQTS
jgi:hypothetical protein